MSATFESSTNLSLIGALFTDPTNIERGKTFLGRYKPVVLQVLGKHGLSGANAEDVFQDTLRKMLVSFQNFTRAEHGGFRKWLRTIAYSAAMNWYNKNPKLDQAAAEALNKTLVESSQKEYHTELFELAMRRAKLEFQESTWQMFIQTKLLERPAKEVAAEMGLSPLTVYGAVRRIKKRLREIFRALDDANRQ